MKAAAGNGRCIHRHLAMYLSLYKTTKFSLSHLLVETFGTSSRALAAHARCPGFNSLLLPDFSHSSI